jgi:hypothetical protein
LCWEQLSAQERPESRAVAVYAGAEFGAYSSEALPTRVREEVAG